MQSLKYLYRIGRGPSSSHTMGPANAMSLLLKMYPDAVSFNVTLYGSLAYTGKGHLTDKIIIDTVKPLPCDVRFDYKAMPEFPNTFAVRVNFLNKESIVKTVLSLGGGAISIDGVNYEKAQEVYKELNLEEILSACEKNHYNLAEYVYANEGNEIKEYLYEVWKTMDAAIERGLVTTGYLPGNLRVKRKAPSFLSKNEIPTKDEISTRRLASYAFACSEENASGGIIVTAPTCGACGIVPSVIKYLSTELHSSKDEIIDALATAGIIGNVVKQNGSISGAEAGCQAEVGTATAMAAAAACSLRKLSNSQTECAAEIAIEHSLGLTCDPIGGYVQIPCIERNAIGAGKALNACYISEFVSDSHYISFDMAVETALRTGRDMKRAYRETAEGGLAAIYKVKGE